VTPVHPFYREPIQKGWGVHAPNKTRPMAIAPLKNFQYGTPINDFQSYDMVYQ